MGFLQRLGTVTAPARRGQIGRDLFMPYYNGFYPPTWTGGLGTGMHVTPELALTLTAMYCGVSMIAQDIGTLPPHRFRRQDDGGKTRDRQSRLAYLLRWQPNPWQTATEYWSTKVGHFILRGWALSEIVTDRVTGQFAGLLPRHPDRCRAERLPSGRLRYRVLEANGQPRYLTSEEVFVVRDFASDPLTPVSRIAFGSHAIGLSLLSEQFAGHVFTTGASASLIASHKNGEMEEEEEAALHASIARYMSGTRNAGGILVIEDDISIEKLGIEPEKLQMMAARDFGVREVARLLKMPGHKLEAAVLTQAYSAREAANLEYLIGTLRPIVISFEQAIQRDLILPEEQDEYFVEFLMDALFRGDMKTRAEYYERAIRSRWMRPSEVRSLENLNPDPRLDELSEGDYRPGSSGRDSRDREEARRVLASRAHVRTTLLVFEAAQRVVRKEVAAVTKLAERHAGDVDAWRAGLQTFYADHAGFVAQALHLETPVAQAYTAQHRTLLERHGVPVMADWERLEAEDLTSLVLDERREAA